MALDEKYKSYYDFVEADRCWGDLLRAQFGKQAGDVRYTRKGEGEPGSSLRTAYEAVKTARAAWYTDIGWPAA